jgi:hypothetical protein
MERSRDEVMDDDCLFGGGLGAERSIYHFERSDSLIENRILHLSQRIERASTDWLAPTCASPSKVVRKRGRCPGGTSN